MSVRELEGALASAREVAAGLDPLLLTPEECERALAAAAALESVGATMKAILAARLAATAVHLSSSSASPETHIASLTGVTPAAAKASIEVGSRLSELEATSAVARAGRLSPSQVQAIVGAAAVNPATEAALLAAAPDLTVGQLRERSAKVTADADPDPDATYARLRQQRCGRRYASGDGFHHLHVQSTAEDLGEIDVALNPIIDELFDAARRAGNRERRDAYMADALVEMARRARGGAVTKPPPTYTAVIRADLGALVRGRAKNGEICEIAGVGPVPVAVARRLLGEALLRLVITKGVEVRNVTSLGRGPTAAQKIALLWEQPVCSVQHCGRRAPRGRPRLRSRVREDEAHPPRRARPPLRPAPRQEDTRELGAGPRDGRTAHGAADDPRTHDTRQAEAGRREIER